MIPETSVIRMFLNRHDLDAVVAGLYDARQDVFFELCVRADFFRVLSHTDMAFINEQRACVDFETVIIPGVGVRGSPDLRGEDFCFVVLNDALSPRGDTFAFAVVPANIHFVEVAVFEFIGSEFEFPITVFEFLATIGFVFLPAVEISDQIDVRRVGCPLTENPAVGGFVKTEIEMTVGEIGQCTFSVLRELRDFPECVVVSAADGFFVRFEPRVLFDQTDVFTHISISCLSRKFG